MNLRRYFAWICVVATAASISESSILTKRSLLKPLLSDHCFTCKAEDRPFAWPLMQYFTKFKDAVVHAFNSIADKVKIDRLT